MSDVGRQWFLLYYKVLAEEKFKWPSLADDLLPLTGEQINWLLDEAELDVAMESLLAQLPDDISPPPPPSGTQKRQRGFSANLLLRERVESRLSEQEKACARNTFFSQVKEELAFIPAQLKVIEYWQEKTAFDCDG